MSQIRASALFYDAKAALWTACCAPRQRSNARKGEYHAEPLKEVSRDGSNVAVFG